MNPRAPRIVYLAVQDPHYPRNARIRSFLETAGCSVAVVPLHGRGPRWRRWATALRALLVDGRRADGYVLAEFSNKFALLAWLWAKANGGILVVDGFVGLHETRIGDWGDASKHSLASRRYAFLDLLAVRLSETYLIDTEYRAAAVRRRHPAASVRSLPVGAPPWARAEAVGDEGARRPSILFYGNYLPLHGAARIVEAVAILRESRPSAFTVTMIGSGSGREDVVRRAGELSLEDVITFMDAMPVDDLAVHLKAAHVVMGVFGSSEKARSVIPNKVWQGLACGAVVVTQRTPALDEISSLVGGQLVQTEADPPAIALSLERALSLPRSNSIPCAADALESYVADRFALEVGATFGIADRS
jgi:hypothetical protein